MDKVDIAKKMFMDNINSFEGLPDFSEYKKLTEAEKESYKDLTKDEKIDYEALTELKKDPEFINRLKLIHLSQRASEFFNKP